MLRWTDEQHAAWKARQAREYADQRAAEANVSFDVPIAQPSERATPESAVLAAVLKALALHPRVAWAHRMNVGAFRNPQGQYVRVGFAGCSDIIGQTVDGRFLAVEVKRPGGKPTAEQIAFLGRVSRAGGVAFVAWSVDDVARGLSTGDAA